MNPEQFQQIADSLPHQPGIYQYFSSTEELLYVGKAKDLRKRVSSYFVRTQDNFKTQKLVSLIHRIDFTLVDSEQDAFLLENSLIKQFQPRFNINLKDDKTYPFIVIRKEAFPRIFLTRRLIRDGSEYLGPFTSVNRVRELLEFIRSHIPLRTCSLNLSQTHIRKNKYRVCLEYHLGNCRGPCEGKQSEEEYQGDLEKVRDLLKGRLGPLIQSYSQQLRDHTNRLEFEQAARIQQKIEALQEYRSRSTIVSPRIGDLDVFSILTEEQVFFVNYLKVLNGTIADTRTLTLEKKVEESREDVLAYAVSYIRETFHSLATEILLPFSLDLPGPGIRIRVPRSGERKKLMELSEKNASYFRQEWMKRRMLHLEPQDEDHRSQLLLQLQEDLRLSGSPVHIECFDNSNFQGSYPVSACVVFRNGEPSKGEYRHFNIRTVRGINDFASMGETVLRRYHRLNEEGKDLPQLVIIDGGKGQLNAAMESIEKLGLTGRMTLIGLAKNQEEIFFPLDQESLRLPYSGQSLRLIRRIRDEVHRFGISFHRKKRSQGTLHNELESIAGIGRQTAAELLRKFRSVRRISGLSAGELASAIGEHRAKLVWSWFHRDPEPGEPS